jgi:CheY-like chemotaxis protein
MPTADPLARPYVLVAETHADTRALYTHAFGVHGHPVTEAADGRDALVHALARVPTLIVAELRLPLIDGTELCEILRRDRATSHVPFLAVTGDGRIECRERAQRAGADAVLIKPVPIETVIKTGFALIDECRNLSLRMERLSRGTNLAQGETASLLDETRALMRSARKSFRRMTTTEPEQPPPVLLCPKCGRSLTYLATHYGGVSARHAERWDDFVCSGECGRFEYRYRTRALRPL